MHWFRKTRYAVALLVIVLTGVSLATRIGEMPPRALLARFGVLVAMLGLLGVVAWADERFFEA